MAQLTEVTATNFDQAVLQVPGPVLVDFWAAWCGPCKMLLPRLEELATQLGNRASIVKVNIENEPEIAARFAVRGVPAMLVFKGGELKSSLSGNLPKEKIQSTLEDWI